jgi:hypothetical protein
MVHVWMFFCKVPIQHKNGWMEVQLDISVDVIETIGTRL